MLLKDKIAVVYGAGGSAGSAVCVAFAREGAVVYLAGRTKEKLDAVAKKISGEGNACYGNVLDASDKQAVNQHLEEIIGRHGRIDISFNLVGMDDMQGVSLDELTAEAFINPVINALTAHFITGTAAIKHMKHRGGVILALTANAAAKPYENIGGFGVACAGIEALCRQLAVEAGMNGVRVVCLRSAGSPDAAGVDEVFNLHATNEGISREAFEKKFAERTMLKRLPKLNEIANAAVLMASDKASAATAAVINLTCGELAD